MVIASYNMDDEMMDKVREKHGEDVLEEHGELILDVTMALAHSIGGNVENQLEEIQDGLKKQMSEVEEYFEGEI